MGLKEKLKRFFRKGAKIEALETSIESPRFDLNRDLNRFAKPFPETPSISQEFPERPKPSPSIELQKDSLQLGVAAGYTGRALKEIESGLNRIESRMVSKDWFASQFEDRTPELIEIMKKHDENISKRFESIQKSLESLKKTAERAPEPIKTELLERVETIKLQLPLTKRMQKLISIVQERGEISYTELAQELDIMQSALRGLLSNTVKRTNKIKRFTKHGRGIVKFVHVSDLNQL